MPSTFVLGAVTIGASVAYAVTRYVVFGGEGTEHLPLYIGNKAASMAGAILVGLASFGRNHGARRGLGLLGLALVGFHLLASFALLDPAYFGKLYEATGRLNGLGELSFLFGAAACIPLVWLFWVTPRVARTGGPARSLVPWLGRLILLLTALHVAVMGALGWLDVHTWPGNLPPITLLAFVATMSMFLVLVVRRRA